MAQNVVNGWVPQHGDFVLDRCNRKEYQLQESKLYPTMMRLIDQHPRLGEDSLYVDIENIPQLFRPVWGDGFDGVETIWRRKES